MPQKVAILYGWAEGPAHAKYLKKSLRHAGFAVTKSAEDADIIIAHSGGIYALPRSSKPALVLVVDYPNWPDKSPYRSLAQNIKFELRHRDNIFYLLRKSLFNTLYQFSRPRQHIRMRYRWKRQEEPWDEAHDYIAVRNKYDSFMHSEPVISKANSNKWTVLSLPGHHDDIWRHPDRYVRIIQSYGKQSN